MNARSILDCGGKGSATPLSLPNVDNVLPPAKRRRRCALPAHSTTWWLLTTALIIVTATAISRAQSYSIDWFTIDGGGGTSTGGVFSISGTIGQPDTGAMSDGNFSITGGFWSLYAVATPGAPLLSVLRTNGVVAVYWPRPATGFVLDRSGTLNGTPPPWTQVGFPYQTNSTHIFISVPAPTGTKFYRLRKP